MKFKKLISVLSALTISFSMLTALNVAEAASLGGKIKVSATLDKYEKKSDTVAFVYIDVKVDLTEAEKLEVYDAYMDETTWEDVIVGNGITTLGAAYSASSGFTFNKSLSNDGGYGADIGAESLAIASISDKAKYITDHVLTFKLAYRTDLNTSGTFTIASASVDGCNSAENNATWAYHTSKGNISVTNLKIPSYNEWSTPVSNVQATKDSNDVITFTTPEENSEIADKYIVVNTAEIVDGSKVTADTRVKVTHTPTGKYKIFGNKMFTEAGFVGEGGIKTKKIAFGIVFTDSSLKGSDFTFEIQGLQSAQE